MSKTDFPSEKSNKTKGIIKKTTTTLGFKGVMIIVVLIVVVIFCLQNIEATSVQFLFWKILEVSKLYLIVISISLGAILGLSLGYYLKKDNQSHLPRK